jgi:3-phosphoshikimate 1-carboxyvinyltransferase
MSLVEIRVPGDKSLSHRALLFAALAHGESVLAGLLPGADCQSTASCLRALGVQVPPLSPSDTPVRIEGKGIEGLHPPDTVLDCGNSGTTARLLLGLLAGAGIPATLDGDESLRRRPMRRVTEPLIRAGAQFTELGSPGCLPIRIDRGISAGAPLEWVSPVASAQVKSALLLAGLARRIPVTVDEPERSRDHTERMLRRMGVPVFETPLPGGGHRVRLGPVPDQLAPLALAVPGDPSSAAFLAAFAVLGGVGKGGELRIRDVGMNSTRAGVFPVLERMGAHVHLENPRGFDDPGGEPVADLRIAPVAGSGSLRGTSVGGAEIPTLIDEIPLLAVVAACAGGETTFRDAHELRVKESDRIEAVAVNLRALGVEVRTTADGLTVIGAARLSPFDGRARTFHDHRIAMAFGVLGALPGNRVEIEDPGMVEVSFPGFWRLLDAVGRGGDGEERGITTPRERPLVITLDGPAGSGKSTTARAVAARLGYGHLDSGALYRAVTHALLESGIPEDTWDAVPLEQLEGFHVTLDPDPDPEAGTFRVRIGGERVEEALRTPEVTSRVSRVARIPAVRDWLLDVQRATGRRGGVVTDGRDMGTVVFPDADLKIFLDADLEERARRRRLQDVGSGGTLTAESVSAEADALAARDAADRSRAVAPLRPADDAILLDTTGLTFEAQVERIVKLALDRISSVESSAVGEIP